MKKLATLLLSVFLLSSSAAYASDGDGGAISGGGGGGASSSVNNVLTTQIFGDILNDGKVSAADSVKLAQYLAGWSISMSDYEKSMADVYHDGAIDSKDSILLAQKLAGWNLKAFPDYTPINSTLVDNLELAYLDIEAKMSIFSGWEYKVLETINPCIKDVIKYEATDIINQEFTKKTYPDEVEAISILYNEHKLKDETEHSQYIENFKSALKINLKISTIKYLVTAFGLSGWL